MGFCEQLIVGVLIWVITEIPKNMLKNLKDKFMTSKQIPKSIIRDTKRVKKLNSSGRPIKSASYENTQAREGLALALNHFEIKTPDSESICETWYEFCTELLIYLEQDDLKGAREVGERYTNE